MLSLIVAHIEADNAQKSCDMPVHSP
jgi:hypothetical protein